MLSCLTYPQWSWAFIVTKSICEDVYFYLFIDSYFIPSVTRHTPLQDTWVIECAWLVGSLRSSVLPTLWEIYPYPSLPPPSHILLKIFFKHQLCARPDARHWKYCNEQIGTILALWSFLIRSEDRLKLVVSQYYKYWVGVLGAHGWAPALIKEGFLEEMLFMVRAKDELELNSHLKK